MYEDKIKKCKTVQVSKQSHKMIGQTNQNILQTKKHISKDIRIYAKKMPIVQMRTNNPMAQSNPELFNNWGTTAHHIVSMDTLKTAYSLLENNDQKLVKVAAKRPMDDTTDEQWLEWPQGNLFYGPNAGIRAEASDDKTAMDTDAEYFISKQQYKKLKGYNDEIQNLISKIQKNKNQHKDISGFQEKLRKKLVSFYHDTKSNDTRVVEINKWKELTTREQIEKLHKIREHCYKTSYLKIPVIGNGTEFVTLGGKNVQKHPNYDRIVLHAGNYYYYNDTDNSFHEIACEVKGINCFIRLTDVSGAIQYLENGFRAQLQYSTWIPEKLFKQNKVFAAFQDQ